MKKIIGFVIVFLCLGTVQALDLASFTPAIDKKVASKSTLKEKITYLKNIQAVLALPVFKDHPEALLFSNLNDYLSNFISVLEYGSLSPSQTPIVNSPNITTTILPSHGDSYLSVDDVNVQKVRDTLLSRHNEERQSKNLSPYSYHSNLEHSAQIWSQKLRNEEITRNTHVRKSGDGDYNYNSIMEWMEEVGNYFSSPGNATPAFSESVGWGYYNCKSGDCTDSLIAALKTTWDFFMSEKKSNGAHYRAITASQFTQMGFGVSIDPVKKRYYVVFHYSVDLVEK